MTLFFLLFFSSCGYSKEEKQYMKQIEESGKVNAINYIRDKYGFTPEITSVEICKDGPDGDPFPSANGDVRVTMNHESKTFTVKISGENPVEISGEKPEEEGRDDYQYDQITQDAKEYFEMLLGCDIYDFYLEYKEKEISDSVYSYEEKNLIHQLYEAGSFEDFLKNYPANIRIDDCINKDLTTLPEDNPDAETFFQTYSKNYRMKAILISYKSEEDYKNGREHTYGRGGVMDFDIWKDGLYICSYRVFKDGKSKGSRFLQQEYDGIIFSYEDTIRQNLVLGESVSLSTKGEEGRNKLTLLGDEWEWMDLKETKGKPLSKVYSVRTNQSGEIAVYIPVDKLKQYQGTSVYIQHFYEDKWWQYEPNLYKTTDKKYTLFVYHGVDNGSFDFGIFK